jgi:hypothetical protein
MRKLVTSTAKILLLFGFGLGCAWLGLDHGLDEADRARGDSFCTGYRAGYRRCYTTLLRSDRLRSSHSDAGESRGGNEAIAVSR